MDATLYNTIKPLLDFDLCIKCKTCNIDMFNINDTKSFSIELPLKGINVCNNCSKKYFKYKNLNNLLIREVKS